MKKRLERFFLIFTAIFFCRMAQALTVTESFTSSANLDSSGGMVWNIGRGELHPPLEVSGWDDGGGATTTSFSVGDGQHGAFSSGRYELFDSDGQISGNVIEINTDAYPELQFTSFNLESGYTLRPVGTNPLIIRSQTDVLVNGAIDCSGENGEDAQVSVNSVRAGGAAHCGGGAGGASVTAGAVPGIANKGEAGGVAVLGGDGGPLRLATGGQGGGGGGAFIRTAASGGLKADPTNGDNSAGASGGSAGTLHRDDGFSDEIDGAGAGGGGGSAFDHPGDVANHSSGGGGGAGGGNIRIYAADDITVAATGEVRADGGDGGRVLGGLKGGGGGGGGGGSVLMFAGGDIVLNGAVTAAPGLGGTTAGGDGGTGAWGRTWIVEKDGFASGAVIEDPETQLNSPGDVRYEIGVTYTVTSTAIEIYNTKPRILSLPITVADLGGSTLTYELASSDSNSLSDLSAFAVSTSYLNSELKRYVRFRIQIDNLSATTPVRIQDLSFNYEGFEQDNFKFTTGCGQVGGDFPPSGFLLFLLPLVFLAGLRRSYQMRIQARCIS